MTDVKYKILPDQIIIFLLVVTLLNITIFPQNSFLNYLLSALVYYLIFLSIYLFTKGRGMGFGDVKLVFLLGLYLGYPKVIVSFYLAFLTGAFFSLILVFIGRKKMKSTIAFGPFLIFSAIISNFYGLELFSVLLNLIGL
jgi:prepilin signal peptidase PulO-like enzyme (type II secretory pathway)